jgi:hypothetical protein
VGTTPDIADIDTPISVVGCRFGFFVEQHQTPVARAVAIVWIFPAAPTV